MKQSTTRGVSRSFLAVIASFVMIIAGMIGVAVAGSASAATGQGECPTGYSQMYAENISGQSIAWNPNADAAAVHSGGGVDESAFKIFIKPEPITAWKLNKPGTAYLGLSNVVWCSKDQPPVKCWDGSDARDGNLANCPATPKCWNGSEAPGYNVANCPATPKCWNGSEAPGYDVANCPATPKCSDGSVAPGYDVANCPVVTPSGPSGPTSTPASVTPVSAPATVTSQPAAVSAPAAATVSKAPAKVAVPAKATLPAGVPAGDGSTTPALPLWVLALVLVGLIAAGASVLGLSRN